MAAAESMKRSAVVGILLVILGSAFVLLPTPVFASPPCGTVLGAGVTTLNANIGPCAHYGLIIGPHTTELNCAGFTITGTPANTKAGIYLKPVTGVTVENCNVKSFRYGIQLISSSGNTLYNNTAIGNKIYGFFLGTLSKNNNLTANTANSNLEGFYVIAGSNSNFFGFNTADSNTKIGFTILTNTNTLNNNTANTNGAINVHGVGFYIGGPHGNVFNNNTADGNIGPAFAGGDGFEIMGGANLNTFNNNTADSNTRDGFYINSPSNTLSGNVAGSNGQYGYQDFTFWAAHLGYPHWDTRNVYGVVLDTDGGHPNTIRLANGTPLNLNILTATDLNF